MFYLKCLYTLEGRAPIYKVCILAGETSFLQKQTHGLNKAKMSNVP